MIITSDNHVYKNKNKINLIKIKQIFFYDTFNILKFLYFAN